MDNSKRDILLQSLNPQTEPGAQEKRQVSVEEAFELVGGFGKFQKYSAVMNMFANAGPAIMLYAFAFLEAAPKFMCQMNGTDGEWTYATIEDNLQDEYCSTTTNYNCQVDWSNPESLHNVVAQLDFYCVSGVYIGLIGALFLFGIVFGSLTVIRQGDTLGRKPVYFRGLLLAMFTTIVLIFSKNALLDYLMMFTAGIAVTMRYYIGYTYNVEMQPQSH